MNSIANNVDKTRTSDTISGVSLEMLPESVPVNASVNASAKALLRLRELIWSGELAGGARIAELAIVEKIGV